MGTITKKLEKLFTAITFAEAGEFDTAREILDTKEASSKAPAGHKHETPDRHGVIHSIPVMES